MAVIVEGWSPAPDEKRIDHRTREIEKDLADRFERRLRNMVYDHDDPGLVAAALAEAAALDFSALCQEIAADRAEGWGGW